MPSFTRKLKIATDENGSYRRTDKFNPPGPFNFTAEVKATLLAPAETTVTAAADIDAESGNPQNQSREFVLVTGEQVDLGEWHISGGNNIFTFSAKTSPPRAHTEIEIELELKV
ncbi:MAG: hypothetical protein WBP93_02990 [Pyrinomonadaceae bacterium]